MACFSLEEFQTAKAAFEDGLKLDPSNSQYKTWIRKCDVELAGDTCSKLVVKGDTPVLASYPYGIAHKGSHMFVLFYSSLWFYLVPCHSKRTGANSQFIECNKCK